MHREDLSAILVVSHANVLYFSGTAFLSQRALRDRPALMVLVAGRPAVFIVERTEEEQAKHEGCIDDIRTYTQFVDDPIRIAADMLRERGAGAGRIGYEELSMTALHFQRISAELPSARLVPVEELLEHVRSLKSAEEINILAEGALHTDAAIREAFLSARPGDTERQIGERMIEYARGKGGLFKHLCLATGPNGWDSHHFPDRTRILPSSPLRVDFGMVWSNYPSDLARTAIVAPAQQTQLETLKRLEDLHQTLIAAMVPGRPAHEIYRLYQSESERRGLDHALPHVGHGLGLSLDNVHEAPVLQPHDRTELQPGMMIAIEPMINGRDGLYHVEDLIEITDAGPRIRSRSADWSDPLVIGG